MRVEVYDITLEELARENCLGNFLFREPVSSNFSSVKVSRSSFCPTLKLKFDKFPVYSTHYSLA
jgi:hypothetical protein